MNNFFYVEDKKISICVKSRLDWRSSWKSVNSNDKLSFNGFRNIVLRIGRRWGHRTKCDEINQYLVLEIAYEVTIAVWKLWQWNITWKTIDRFHRWKNRNYECEENCRHNIFEFVLFLNFLFQTPALYQNILSLFWISFKYKQFLQYK